MQKREIKWLSDPQVRQDVTDVLGDGRRLLRMEIPLNSNLITFKGVIADLSATRERFSFVTVEKDKLSNLSNSDPQSQAFKDEVSDWALDMGYDIDTTGLLLGSDDEEQLYLNQCGGSYEYHIIDDEVFVRKVTYVEMYGQSYNSHLKNVDLTKFINRHYDCKDGTPFDPTKHKLYDLDVAISYYGQEAYPDFTIDFDLLHSWCIFQTLKLVFPVINDPFVERDGLIHWKPTSGYGHEEMKFDVPPQIKNLSQTIQDLKICRRHHDSEWFARR